MKHHHRECYLVNNFRMQYYLCHLAMFSIVLVLDNCFYIQYDFTRIRQNIFRCCFMNSG